MKKKFYIFILSAVGIIILLTYTTSYSGFLIKLKNGREIYTEAYQTEGNYLILQFRGGVLKISKNDVQSISQEKRRIEDEEQQGKKEEKVEKVGKTGTEGKEDKKETKEVKKETPPKTEKASGMGQAEIDQYKKRKAEIRTRLDEAKKVYFDTTDKEEKNKARKIMLSISNELYNLQDEVKKNNNGVLPKWWLEE